MPKPPNEQPREIMGTLKLADIRPSGTNPRQHFDPVKLEELCESIKAKGLLAPLVVRPVGKAGREPRFEGGKWFDVEHFELIAGERRLRAAKMAGLQSVAVSIRIASDQEVLELQAVENEQRADVTPGEQAAHYQRMVEAGRTIYEIGAAIGRSPSTVRSTLYLTRMPPALAKAVESGEVPRSTAELVCRVPSEEVRVKLAQCVLIGFEAELVDEDKGFLGDWKPELSEWRKRDRRDHPLSYRETKELIREHCQIELKAATFSRKSLDLLPEAGSCDACPKRAGNDPELTDVRADVCTDPSCFRAKTLANATRIKAEHEASGKTVLSGKEAEDLFGYGGLRHDAPYLDMAEQTYDSKAGKNKPNSKLLAKCKDDVVIAIDDNGVPHQLVPRDVATKALKEQGITLHSNVGRRSGPKSEDEKKEEARRRFEAKVQRERDNDVMRAVNAKSAALFLMPAAAADLGKLLAHLVDRATAGIWDDELGNICRRHGLTSKNAYDDRAAIRKHAEATMENDALFGLLVECMLVRELRSEAKILKAFGIDRKTIEKQVRARLKDEKAKPKVKAMPAAARNAEPEIEDIHTWDKIPVGGLAIMPVTKRLLESQDIQTLGELAEKLDAGETLGLPRHVISKIAKEIDQLRGD